MNKFKIVKGRRTHFSKLYVVLIAALFVSSSAMAGLSGTFGDDVPNYSSIVSLDKYSGPGSLTSVKLTLDIYIDDATYSLDNDGSSAASVTVDLGVGAFLASTDVALPSASTSLNATGTYSNTVALAANDGDSTRGFNTGGGDYVSFNTGKYNMTSIVWYVDAADFADYTGAGTFDVTVTISDILQTITGNSGVAMQSIAPLVGGTLSVEYVPEPVTLALMGLGGLFIRRKK